MHNADSLATDDTGNTGLHAKKHERHELWTLGEMSWPCRRGSVPFAVKAPDSDVCISAIGVARG
jgi:hypothetical protein